MKRRIFIASAAVTLAFAAHSAAHAQAKWDLPSAYPSFNFHVKNLEQFAADVNAASDNKLTITVHPGASLFKAPEIKRAVQGSQAQAGEFFMVSFQNEWPLFGADGIPFLTSSYADAYKLYQAQKPFLEQKLDQQGMVLLYTAPWPPQGIYTKKPITRVEDFKGMKWRAYSPATSRIGELLGAQPVIIREAELSQALATGVVDGLMTSSATGADNNLHENLKYYYNVQAWIPKNAIVANKRAFNALDAATQQAVRTAAAQTEERVWAQSQEVDAASRDKIQAAGITLAETPPELMEALQKIGATITQEWSAKAGADGKAFLETYQANR